LLFMTGSQLLKFKIYRITIYLLIDFAERGIRRESAECGFGRVVPVIALIAVASVLLA
jgi:hypothetical protein